ncbi:MAG: 4'-phosphopantetheinyl transferase superfamily protein [Ruminococcaceae bacterium]|nr:4'-phosphopantetheinyl transferase superfamily protein [Oscillospiraceae bacterium]
MFPLCRNGKGILLFKLYYTEAMLSHTDEAALFSVLDEDRRLKLTRRPAKDRISAAAATCLLRYALIDTGNGVFSDAPVVWEGKPHFADPVIPLYFNLSHTVDRANGRFAAAVLLSEEDDVGVDLEYVHLIKNRDALMRRIFTPYECTYIAQSGTESAFFDIWCAKEAFVKRTGEGFARPLSSVSVDVSEKKAVSGEVSCDLFWHAVGDCRICCAADDLSSGVQLTALTMEHVLSV